METAERSVPELGGLARRARICLYAQAAFSALAGILAVNHGPGYSGDVGSRAYLLTALFQLAAFVFAALFTLRWIYLANVNVRALGAEGMVVAPGWAVGWYFVPLANLVLPFQSMRELWKASAGPRDWEIVKPSAILGWWWLFWLASGLAASVAFRLGLDDRYADAMRLSETLTIVSDVLTIPASLLMAAIVGRVTAMQAERRHQT